MCQSPPARDVGCQTVRVVAVGESIPTAIPPRPPLVPKPPNQLAQTIDAGLPGESAVKKPRSLSSVISKPGDLSTPATPSCSIEAPRKKRRRGAKGKPLLEWLVQQTRGSPRYRADFRFLQHRSSEVLACDQSSRGFCSAAKLLALHVELVHSQSCSRAGQGSMGFSRVVAVDDRLSVVLDEVVVTPPRPGCRISMSPCLETVRARLMQLVAPSTVLAGHGLHQGLELLRLHHARLVDTSHLFISPGTGQRPALETLCTHLLSDSEDATILGLLSNVSSPPPVLAAMRVMGIVQHLAALKYIPPPPSSPPPTVMLPDNLEDDFGACCLKIHRLPRSCGCVRQLLPPNSLPFIRTIYTWSKGGQRGADVHFHTSKAGRDAYEILSHRRVGVDSGGYLFKELPCGTRVRSVDRVPKCCAFKVHQLPRGADSAFVSSLFPSEATVMPFTGSSATVVFQRPDDVRSVFESLPGTLALDSGGFPFKKLPCGVKVKWDLPIAANETRVSI